MTRLGQHFLINRGLTIKITEAADLKRGDFVIEIGPGHGELTDNIINTKPASLVALERDPALAKNLEKKYAGNKNINIITGNALDTLPHVIKKFKLKNRSYKLIGNIPYYVTGKLLRTIGELAVKPNMVLITIQSEVADRIVAEAGRMNLLAASIQIWGKPVIVGRIPRADFYPIPEVDSAVLLITTRSGNVPAHYFEFIRALFKQPRKTIFNNLRAKKKCPEKALADLLKKEGVRADLRPQSLSVNKILNLSEKLRCLSH